MQQLNPRLCKIAEVVKIGSRVADIGTDHGYLPIYLIKNNISKTVIACDIRTKPLENARKNIKSAGVNVSLRLSDGLEKISENEVDTVIIAGMGGEVISGIIENCKWIKSSYYTLILQPMTSAEILHRYLFENGFSIVTEEAVEETGRVYCVITAVYSGEIYKPEEYKLFIGKLNPKNPQDMKYINKQIKRIKKCCDDTINVPKMREQYCMYDRIYKKLITLG